MIGKDVYGWTRLTSELTKTTSDSMIEHLDDEQLIMLALAVIVRELRLKG